MISIDRVTKIYYTHREPRCVLEDISGVFPMGKSVGILGGNGSGKSTLLRLIAGTQDPTRGKIRRDCRVSWPLGFTGAFAGSLTGAENARFAARIHGADCRAVLDYVHYFAELGDALKQPIKTYSSGMKARLAFGLSLALSFDFYLIDEITAVGDTRFKQRCRTELKERLKASAVIMVSHSVDTTRDYCTHGAVLHRRKMTPVVEIDEALRYYDETLKSERRN